MKVLIASLTSLLLLTCGGPKTPSIKIKTGLKGDKAQTGDQLRLSLKTPLEAYEVQYFLN